MPSICQKYGYFGLFLYCPFLAFFIFYHLFAHFRGLRNRGLLVRGHQLSIGLLRVCELFFYVNCTCQIKVTILYCPSYLSIKSLSEGFVVVYHLILKSSLVSSEDFMTQVFVLCFSFLFLNIFAYDVKIVLSHFLSLIIILPLFREFFQCMKRKPFLYLQLPCDDPCLQLK